MPFTRLAREAGREMMANIVALGALAAVTEAVSAAGLEGARSWPGCPPRPGS